MSEITLRNLISTFSFSLIAKGHVFFLLLFSLSELSQYRAPQMVLFSFEISVVNPL